MIKKRSEVKNKLPFLGWIVLPILGVLLATNYILGLTRKPTWAVIDDINISDPTNVTNIEPQKIDKYEWNRNAVVTFWFDDAWISQYKTAFPILSEEGLKAAIAVPTDAVGWDKYMTWAQIKRLSFNGWEITSHSKSHQCDLSKLDHPKIIDELSGSQRVLQEKGYITSVFVTPCGVSNDEFINTSKDYYIAVRSTDEGTNPIPVEDPYHLQIYELKQGVTSDDAKDWIDQAVSEKTWLILMFHKVDESGEEFSTTPEILKEITKYVKEKNIDNVLPSQILNI